MKDIIITIEDTDALIMEMAYINGVFAGLRHVIPPCPQLNKILEQITGKKNE